MPAMFLYKCTECGTGLLRCDKIRKVSFEKFPIDDTIRVTRYSLLKAYSKPTQNLFEAYPGPTGFPLVFITITVAM